MAVEVCLGIEPPPVPLEPTGSQIAVKGGDADLEFLGRILQGQEAILCAYRDVSESIIGGAVSDPRNHHYVPQAYLRGFANDQDQVAVRWRLDDRPSFVTNIRNVASERDFYTFVRADTGKVDYLSFEQGINRSEEMLREALTAYLAGGSGIPIDTLKLRIAVGVGFQMTRTRYFRRKMERIADYAARTFAAHHRPELEEALKDVHIVPGNDLHLQWIPTWAVQLAATLQDRSWFIVRAVGRRFITSDNPVYGIAGRSDALDVGVFAASEIRYAIDPATALMWTPRPGHDAGILMRAGEVDDFNVATFANAYEQAYAHPDDRAYLDQLRKHTDTLVDRINVMVKAPEFKRSGTRRFDPEAANEDAED